MLHINKNVQNSTQINEDMLQRKLHAAMEYAINVCVLGASNKIEDIAKTHAWSYVQQFRGSNSIYEKSSNEKYSVDDQRPNVKLNDEEDKLIIRIKNWYCHVDDFKKVNDADIYLVPYSHFNPLQDNGFNITLPQINMLAIALRAIAARHGNCGVLSDLVSKYLWQYPAGIHKIEVISMKIDHEFVIVNRSGTLNDPDTWGNAWIIDAWYKNGIIYPASEFTDKINEIKEYAKSQLPPLNALFIYPKSDGYDLENAYSCIVKIKPSKNLYPSYSTYFAVEDYYRVNNVYPKNMIDQLNQYLLNHKIAFKKCLEEIVTLNNDPARVKLTALLSACIAGNLPVVKALYKKDINLIHSYASYVPLVVAAWKGHLDIVKFLLKKGANLEIETAAHVNAISAAAYKGHYNIVEFLLTQHADLEYRSITNATPLIIAARKGHASIVQLLCESGAKLNAVDNEGNTALTWAIANGHLQSVNILKQYENKSHIKAGEIGKKMGGNSQYFTAETLFSNTLAGQKQQCPNVESITRTLQNTR